MYSRGPVFFYKIFRVSSVFIFSLPLKDKELFLKIYFFKVYVSYFQSKLTAKFVSLKIVFLKANTFIFLTNKIKTEAVTQSTYELWSTA